MAKLKISAELLAQALFGDCVSGRDTKIDAVEFDYFDKTVILYIRGPDVPDTSGFVTADVTVQRKDVKFVHVV